MRILTVIINGIVILVLLRFIVYYSRKLRKLTARLDEFQLAMDKLNFQMFVTDKKLKLGQDAQHQEKLIS